ncbi:hypothetical protein, variant 2 [Aphanomyces invadans]|nr:hypothetical protein, variant 2 [Aphanomyces invadans]ETW07019.1 hypothetical protein, variant 2 [Aphanomyces invadans]|eukprot:XP_008865094.1 hypothetical protein, variant 2 [Aphanomyces invadans]
MHLLNEVQTISDAVVVKLHALDDDVLSLQQCNPDEHDDAPNDVPLNSYYHFDSTGKKLKTKWDTYDVDAELNKLDEEETGAADVAAAKPSRSQVKPRPSTAVLLRKVGELEHEFEAILAFLDTIRGDEEVRIVRKQLVGAINDTYLATLDRIKAQLTN